jgi:hypothetical protein
VDALDHLAHASTHSSLVAQVCNVLARLSDDHASLLGRDNGTERQLRLGVLLLSARRDITLVVDAKTLE